MRERERESKQVGEGVEGEESTYSRLSSESDVGFGLRILRP